MLVLSRNESERVIIGGEIVITVVKGQGVRLGIDAPDDVRILREELCETPEAMAAADAALRLDDQTLADYAADFESAG